ncbi:MAG: hypothetical protein H8D94_01305 [Candidatus Pelagibacter sp.]|nr:hypothetical protein [Candidatus Pelagibacter sp.]
MKKSLKSSVKTESKVSTGKKSINGSEFKEIITQPTNINGQTPDREGRVTIGVTHEGEQKWIWDGKEEISMEDGFYMSAGKESIPGSKDIHTGWSRPWETAYDRIFNNK